MYLRSRNIFTLGFLIAALSFSVTAQANPTPTPTPEPAKTPRPTPTPKGVAKVTTAEQVVESSIFLYGFPGGRATLNQIRKTTQERGTAKITNPDGRIEQANYQRFVIRSETLPKEKIRLDQEFPTARYSLVYNDSKIYGIYNNSVFTPRDDASKTFENQIVHGIEAYLRYKENESKIELAGREKFQGVEYYLIDLTAKHDRKTRFYVSVKSFRVMMLTYEDGGVKYRRRFYDYNYAQSTLVPYSSILWADDKIVEEIEIGTITFGQKVDEALFNAS